MIPVADVIKLVRQEEKDINEVRYSDWDILNAINKAMRLIANKFAMTNSDFMEKVVAYTNPSEGRIHHDEPYSHLVEYNLPNDYVAIDKVVSIHGYELSPSVDGVVRYGQYKISSNKIYVRQDVYLWYKYSFDDFAKTDNIDLPKPFFDFIGTCTRYLLTGKEDVATQFIMDNALKLIPARKYSHAKQKLPWKV